MLIFYTFCCDINRHTKTSMIQCLKILLKSLEKHINCFRIICFSNFIDELESRVPASKYIEYRTYYDKQVCRMYADSWLNLSFNKINIFKDLYDEFQTSCIWIDLDTVVCSDLSFMESMDTVFIANGGKCSTPNVLFTNCAHITVPRNTYIQGNFWKLNINVYYELLSTLEEIKSRGLKLRYDLQDLFSYYAYIQNETIPKHVHILGQTSRINTINGLSVWSESGNTHATKEGLRNLYWCDGVLKSRLYPNHYIYILSFTFFTIQKLYNDEQFINLFGKS